MQYIAHPVNTWQKLRSETPGVYEKPVTPAPDRNGWFHARIAVAGTRVQVFVDGATEPSLTVTALTPARPDSGSGWGTVHGGVFANLTITRAR